MLIMLIQTRARAIQFANAKFEPGVESKDLFHPAATGTGRQRAAQVLNRFRRTHESPSLDGWTQEVLGLVGAGQL
jgi:hypothetical protein